MAECTDLDLLYSHCHHRAVPDSNALYCAEDCQKRRGLHHERLFQVLQGESETGHHYRSDTDFRPCGVGGGFLYHQLFRSGVQQHHAQHADGDILFRDVHRHVSFSGAGQVREHCAEYHQECFYHRHRAAAQNNSHDGAFCDSAAAVHISAPDHPYCVLVRALRAGMGFREALQQVFP